MKRSQPSLENSNSEQPEFKKRRLFSSCSEEEAGITEFCNRGNRQEFLGLIKTLYSDFVVREIDYNGNIACLNSKIIGNQAIKEEEVEDEEVDIETIFNDGVTKLEKLVGEEFAASVKDLALKAEENKSSKKKTHYEPVVCSKELPKEQRKTFHTIIREYFSELISDTEIQSSGERLMRVAIRGQGGDNFDKRDNRLPVGRRYLHFVLAKENCDTVSAISLIASKIRNNPKIFSFAGTKDKRAVTTQRACVHAIPKENIQNIKLKGIKIGKFSYRRKPIKLGQLGGNQFTVVLRNLDVSDEDIKSATELLKTYGFINYYGMQRFGTGKSPTHHIGLAMLGNDWEKAFNLVLSSHSHKKKVAEAIEAIQDRDLSLAKHKIPKHMSIEKKMVDALASHSDRKGPPAFSTAFHAIPGTLRKMYLHAFQSYVWNHMASRRLTKYGLHVVPGDIVLPRNKAQDRIKQQQQEQIKEEEIEEIENDATDALANVEDEVASPPQTNIEDLIEIVKEGEEDQYTIFDVMLPLPGFRVQFPKHDIDSKAYEKFLENNNIHMEDLNKRSISLPGDYRYIVYCPADLETEIVRYDNPKLDLVDTEMKDAHGAVQNGRFKAAILKFSLQSSMYATMLLREFTLKSSLQDWFSLTKQHVEEAEETK